MQKLRRTVVADFVSSNQNTKLARSGPVALALVVTQLGTSGLREPKCDVFYFITTLKRILYLFGIIYMNRQSGKDLFETP